MSEWLEFRVLGYLESFDGSKGFEIRDKDWKLGDPITRDLRDFEAESIMEVTHILCFFVKM